MSGIGEKIIDEIGRASMFATHDVDGPIERPLIYVWSSSAAEQLEALIEQHIREMSAEDVMRIRWPEEWEKKSP